MKIHDRNNYVPLMSEQHEDAAILVSQAEVMFEMLTRHKSWDRWVVADDFNSYKMSDATMCMIDEKIIEFEWSFPDKYDRIVRCYITRNV